MKNITVLLADDHNVVREGLKLLLEADEDLQVVGEAENGRQAVVLAQKFKPDVVVLDVAMPLMNGLEAARQISREVPRTKILALSSYSEDEYIRQLIEVGASGYLIKQTAANNLRQAIRQVAQGKTYFSPEISRRLAAQKSEQALRGQTEPARTPQLTSRETEVLQLIAEGLANKQIAAELNISIKTVEKHRQQVMNKLGIHDVAGLTRHAISRGIIEAPLGPPQTL